MVQLSQRTGFTGSALVGLLARLTDLEVPEAKQSLSDRLSQWLGWSDAISLSSALNTRPAATASGTGARQGVGLAEEAECARVRAALAKAIADELRALDPLGDFAPYRRHYVARQQAMEAGIGPLRGRLRTALANRSPAMAQLAAVDAVMEQALAAHEQRLLATVPSWLEKHFKRLRQAELAAQRDAAASPDADRSAQPAAWRDGFGKDMQGVLLAELDIRFQPVEGLLEALRAT